jgi:class 3 adenylate cyclase
LNALVKDEYSEVRRVSSLPVVRSFVFLDVSDFSKYSAGQEAIIINSRVGTVNDCTLWGGEIGHLHRGYEALLCIGDGYIFVFRRPVNATYFAAHLAHLIEVLVANGDLPVGFHFRTGVHVGPVYTFWDPGRKDWNYIGEGINGGSRVLGAVGKEQDDVVFVSGQVRQAILAAQREFPQAPRILSCLQNRGRKADKHGNPWRVYELNHTALCGNDVPLRFRVSD